MTARALSKSATAQRSSPSLTSPGASTPQLPNQSVQADGMRDRLPSGSTTNNNGTPRRVSPVDHGQAASLEGMRAGVIATEVGTSREWVVLWCLRSGALPCRAFEVGSGRILDRRVLHLIKMWLDCPWKKPTIEDGGHARPRRETSGAAFRRARPGPPLARSTCAGSCWDGRCSGLSEASALAS